ncbi:hypothetical protein K5549_015279 [Capra hircus]|nr:hypothetical protein K5549_015279 [Capra hircus]
MKMMDMRLSLHTTVMMMEFHYVKNGARFFVQKASTASALMDVSYKIYDEKNQKIPIFVNPSAVPYSVRNKLGPEKMEKLKLAFSKRFDVSQQSLDLQKLRFDPNLVGHDIEMILNRRNCMAAALQIIRKNFPELLSLNLSCNKLYHLDGLSDIVHMVPTIKILDLSKNELNSMWELNKMKGLKLEELWLQENPLCDSFPDQSTYLRYYLIYDSGNRSGLLSAYHHKACFSLTIPFHSEDLALSSLCAYFKNSRNMKKVKDPNLRVQQLKHTNSDIVRALCVLPQTQHDLSSFLVDMWFQTGTLLCFSVNGVFKEVEEGSQDCVRAFTRTFIITPASSSSLCIVNDELFVMEASPKNTQSAFSIPVPTPSTSSVATLSEEQQQMVQAFSTQSGMNCQWSQKCLQDNEWNYTRAGQVFCMFKTEGKIPEEAFKEIP